MKNKVFILTLFFLKLSALEQQTGYLGNQSGSSGSTTVQDCINNSNQYQDAFARSEAFTKCLSNSAAKNINDYSKVLSILQEDALQEKLQNAISAFDNMISAYCVSGSGRAISDYCSDQNIQRILNAPVEVGFAGCSASSFYNYFVNNYFMDPFFYINSGMFIFLLNELIQNGVCSLSDQGSQCDILYQKIKDAYNAMLNGNYYGSLNQLGSVVPFNVFPNLGSGITDLFNYGIFYNQYSVNSICNDIACYSANQKASCKCFNVYELYKNYPKALFTYAMLPYFQIAAQGASIIENAYAVSNATIADGANIVQFAPLFTPIGQDTGLLFGNLDPSLQSAITNDLITPNISNLKKQNCLAYDSGQKGCQVSATTLNPNPSSGPGFQLANVFPAYLDGAPYTLPAASLSILKPTAIGSINYDENKAQFAYFDEYDPSNNDFPDFEGYNFTPSPDLVYKNSDSSAQPTPHPWQVVKSVSTEVANTSGEWITGVVGIDTGKSIANIVMGDQIAGSLWESIAETAKLQYQEKTSNLFQTTYKSGLYPKLFNCCPDTASSSSSSGSSQGLSNSNSYFCDLGTISKCMYQSLLDNIKAIYEINNDVVNEVQQKCDFNEIGSKVQSYATSCYNDCVNSNQCLSPTDTSEMCTSCIKSRLGVHADKIKESVEKCGKKISFDLYKRANDTFNNLTKTRINYAKFIYNQSIDKLETPQYVENCTSDKKCPAPGSNKICSIKKSFGPAEFNLTYNYLCNWDSLVSSINDQASLISYIHNQIYSNCPTTKVSIDLAMVIIGYVMMVVMLPMMFMGSPAMVVIMGVIQIMSQTFSAASSFYSALSQSQNEEARFLNSINNSIIKGIQIQQSSSDSSNSGSGGQ